MAEIKARVETEHEYNTVWHWVVVTHGIRGDEDTILCDGPEEQGALAERINNYESVKDERDEAVRLLERSNAAIHNAHDSECWADTGEYVGPMETHPWIVSEDIDAFLAKIDKEAPDAKS